MYSACVEGATWSTPWARVTPAHSFGPSHLYPTLHAPVRRLFTIPVRDESHVFYVAAWSCHNPHRQSRRVVLCYAFARALFVAERERSGQQMQLRFMHFRNSSNKRKSRDKAQKPTVTPRSPRGSALWRRALAIYDLPNVLCVQHWWRYTAGIPDAELRRGTSCSRR